MRKPIVVLAGVLLACCAPAPGEKFRAACVEVAAPGDVEICMQHLYEVYRGPDQDRYKRNAAEQWAVDLYGPNPTPQAGG